MMNLYQRILAVMGEISYIQKQGKHAQGFRYAKHDDVMAAVRPYLIQHGIVALFSAESHVRETSDGGTDRSGNPKMNVFSEICGVLTLINVDDPADRHDVRVYGYGIDNSDKSIGKAISYACKYAILKAFFLETGDDPEADDFSYRQPAASRATTAPPAPVEPPAPPQDPESAERAGLWERWKQMRDMNRLNDDYLKQWLASAEIDSFKTARPTDIRRVLDNMQRALDDTPSPEAADPPNAAAASQAAPPSARPVAPNPAETPPPASRQASHKPAAATPRPAPIHAHADVDF